MGVVEVLDVLDVELVVVVVDVVLVVVVVGIVVVGRVVVVVGIVVVGGADAVVGDSGGFVSAVASASSAGSGTVVDVSVFVVWAWALTVGWLSIPPRLSDVVTSRLRSSGIPESGDACSSDAVGSLAANVDSSARIASIANGAATAAAVSVESESASRNRVRPGASRRWYKAMEEEGYDSPCGGSLPSCLIRLRVVAPTLGNYDSTACPKPVRSQVRYTAAARSSSSISIHSTAWWAWSIDPGPNTTIWSAISRYTRALLP